MEEIKKLIDDLRVLIEQKCDEIKSLVTASPSTRSTPSKKRKPNKYTLFMKKCIGELKNKNLMQQEKFAECAGKYRELKAQNKI